MSSLKGKSFVVTGGSSGIGRATAELISEQGGRVLITGTNQAKLDSVANGNSIIRLRNDSGSPHDAEILGAEALRLFGKIDGAFINAGFVISVGHHEVTAEQFDAQYAVNVRGPILQAKHLAPLLIDGGSLLFNTSEAQHMGMEGGVLYCSSKAALRSVVRVLCKELSPRAIRVNAVSPGLIDTTFMERAGIPAEQASEMMESFRPRIPLDRVALPTELAAAAVFLMSSDASYVNGAELVVDGGLNQI